MHKCDAIANFELSSRFDKDRPVRARHSHRIASCSGLCLIKSLFFIAHIANGYCDDTDCVSLRTMKAPCQRIKRTRIFNKIKLLLNEGKHNASRRTALKTGFKACVLWRLLLFIASMRETKKERDEERERRRESAIFNSCINNVR